MADTLVTTSITGAKFSDGSTLSGTWTSEYTAAGLLVAVTKATFVVSGSGGTTTFTGGGTLPYANTPAATSYEIHFQTTSSGGGYSGLYVDWKSQNPTSFYEGSPSLYTSVLNAASSSPATPLRLVSDGSSGSGSLPIITGLSVLLNSTDITTLLPFAAVVVTDTDITTTTSATITLNRNGFATDADGVLSGIGLTKIAAGTYSLAATSPAALSVELNALKFTPTPGQVPAGQKVATLFNLSINDSDGSVSTSTTLTVTAACFLRGTRIATPSGEAAVETLRAGDLVTTIENGIPIARAVAWMGGRAVDVADSGHRDEAFPVRIRKDAFAAGIPHRDLLLTGEHCILTEAGLVPVRMLVNGGSIVVDRSIPGYDFFHVELDRHGILLAEGLATESYLDTGNRDLLVDGMAGARTGPDPIVADPVMAAPLAVTRTLVEPIWNRLAERARDLGFDGTRTSPLLTGEPDLRLRLDDGREIPACWHHGQRHMFHIPCDTRPVRLLSRTAVPAEVIGPFVDDRRTLGVAVDRLVLWTGLDDKVIDAADLTLDGWHAAEGTHRWTNGEAELDLPQAGAESFLDVHVTATALYREPIPA